jgi:hypothetical protein
MISKATSALATIATIAVLAHAPAHAQPIGDATVDPRPADPTANLPSDTGAQTTLPSGAVTGAGQPQGTLPQPDDGAPGGLEQRARDRRSGAANTGGGQPAPPARGDSFDPRAQSPRPGAHERQQ